MYLLTFSGKILCKDLASSSFVQMELGEALSSGAAIKLTLPNGQADFKYRNFLEARSQCWSMDITSGELQGFQIESNGGGRTVSIRANNRYMCCQPDYAGGTIRVDRTVVGDWEKLVCLSDDDVETIKIIMSNDWVIESLREVVPRQFITLDRPFALSVGKMTFDLRYNVPFMPAGVGMETLRVGLLKDGWRTETLHVLRPLFLFTAFGSNAILEQLYIALDSLVRHGRHKGDIRVISDKSHEEICRNVPSLNPSQLSVQTCNSADWMGYVAAKYLLLDDAALTQYQPIIFNDPDVVFDCCVISMVAAVATSRHIAAPAEHQSPVRNRISVGSELLREDGYDPGMSSGLNAGTLAIPNLVEHGETLATIRRIIVNRAILKGRDHHKWIDQEILNYVASKGARFDRTLMSSFVRQGFPGVERDPERAVGLVHFWPPGKSSAKAMVMRSYLQTLDCVCRPT